MGGNSQTTNTKSKTSMQQTGTTSAPGTSYGTALLDRAAPLADQVMGGSAFQGDRVAAPTDLGAGNYAAQWGSQPDVFIPQRTTADNATKANITHVDLNPQEAITAGMGAADANAARIPGLVNQGYDRWEQILGGQSNPQLDALLTRLQQEHAEGAAQNTNAMADVFGAQGAYGGSNMGRELTWLGEQQQQELDAAIAGLLYNDYNQNQQMLLQAPEALAAFAGVSGIPAEQYARYGGMRQQNLADAAATADANAQIGYDNAWNQGTLNDQNAALRAQDDLAKWEAAYQQDASRIADLQGREAAQTAGRQADMDNNYLNWLAQQEYLGSQISNMGQLIGFSGMVPGSTSSSSGTSTSNSTSTTEQKTDPWQIAASLGGAALQAFSPGGLFSGGLSALGGGMKAFTGAGAQPINPGGLTALAPPPLPYSPMNLYPRG